MAQTLAAIAPKFAVIGATLSKSGRRICPTSVEVRPNLEDAGPILTGIGRGLARIDPSWEKPAPISRDVSFCRPNSPQIWQLEPSLDRVRLMLDGMRPISANLAKLDEIKYDCGQISGMLAVQNANGNLGQATFGQEGRFSSFSFPCLLSAGGNLLSPLKRVWGKM